MHHDLRGAEVSNFQLLTVVNKNILGLQIAVDDLIGFHNFQPLSQLQSKADFRLQVQLGLVDQLQEVPAIHHIREDSQLKVFLLGHLTCGKVDR